jgi:hypothetical protein
MPFQPGNHYGKGRPRGSHIDWCREFANKEGKAILIKWARSSDAKASMAATTLIYAYGLGKPVEHHELSGSLTLDQVIAEAGK